MSTAAQQTREELVDYLVAAELERLCKLVNNKRYTVVPAAVNWAAWDFDAKPFAMAFQFADQGFLEAVNPVTVSLEAFMKIPAGKENEGIDALTMAEMKWDVRRVFLHFIESKQANGRDALIQRPIMGTDKMTEVWDGVKRVQGVVALLVVEF